MRTASVSPNIKDESTMNLPAMNLSSALITPPVLQCLTPAAESTIDHASHQPRPFVESARLSTADLWNISRNSEIIRSFSTGRHTTNSPHLSSLQISGEIAKVADVVSAMVPVAALEIQMGETGNMYAYCNALAWHYGRELALLETLCESCPP